MHASIPGLIGKRVFIFTHLSMYVPHSISFPLKLAFDCYLLLMKSWLKISLRISREMRYPWDTLYVTLFWQR